MSPKNAAFMYASLCRLDAKHGTHAAIRFSHEYEDGATDEDFDVYLDACDTYLLMDEIRETIRVHLEG